MSSKDLFAQASEDRLSKEAPLAARLRPRTLEEFVGQEHALGPGRLLRRAIQADQLSSLIFYGPPGTGKTTLAMVIANTTRSRFVTLNAVLTGVRDIRRVVDEAREQHGFYGVRTILFVDEVHRWNRAQQDALLPWVENGTVILIGATTENPWFSVNRPLLSRSRVFQLVSLTEDELRQVAKVALADQERGYGKLHVELLPEALNHLVHVANGDARSLLNALELAVETTVPGDGGVIRVDMTVAEESIQQRAVLYDREGDYHFDTISAFIKSLRGSDPDAALYWLAKMVRAGEDPRFIFRRMLILASEDVGLASPNALILVSAAAEAFERVGLPEGQFHLAEAALYLATAPKSNSVMGYFDALKSVEEEVKDQAPAHLKDASRDKEGLGHGEGYIYPHAYRDHWVAQQYLPDALQGKVFYQPGDQGYERDVRDQVTRHREEQLAAMLEGHTASHEIMTFSPSDRAQERWLMRAVSDSGRRLGEIRDRLLDSLQIQRHHLLLDLNAGTGLLTWEALRRAPEGGVWSQTTDVQVAQALRQQAGQLDELSRPIILEGLLAATPQLLAAAGYADVRFDFIIGRNALAYKADKGEMAGMLARLLLPSGKVALSEIVPRRTQRLYDLVDVSAVAPELRCAWEVAEEAIYSAADDPMVNWDAEDLRRAFEGAGFSEVQIREEVLITQRIITSAMVARWLGGTESGRKSYAERLAEVLTTEQIETVRSLFEHKLTGQTVPWHSVLAWVSADNFSRGA